MTTVEVGQKAPAFALRDREGRTHRLKDYAGRPAVLHFYPEDDTPGCAWDSAKADGHVEVFAAVQDLVDARR